MLAPTHRHHYHEFLTALEQLHHTAEKTANLQSDLLIAHFQEVQQIFTSPVKNLSGDEANAELGSRMQSYLTEIDRLMRLLQMDIMFLQAARNPATVQQRLSATRDRIKNLIGFAEAILQQQ